MATDKITVGIAGLDEIIAGFGGLPEQIAAAQRAALNKVANEIRNGMRKAIAAQMGITQTVLKRRAVTQRATVSNPASAAAWFGLNELPATLKNFGSIKVTPTGAAAGQFHYPGAFRAKLPSSMEAAFRRSAAAANATGRDQKGRLRKNRLPMFIVGELLDTPENQAIIAAQSSAAETRLPQVLAEQLDIHINIKPYKS